MCSTALSLGVEAAASALKHQPSWVHTSCVAVWFKASVCSHSHIWEWVRSLSSATPCLLLCINIIALYRCDVENYSFHSTSSAHFISACSFGFSSCGHVGCLQLLPALRGIQEVLLSKSNKSLTAAENCSASSLIYVLQNLDLCLKLSYHVFFI